MLLVEFYDNIMKYLKPITNNIAKQYKVLMKQKEELNEQTAKYELLIKI